MISRFFPIVLASLFVALADAAEPTRAEIEFFENKIRPVLVNRCYKCHSSEGDKLRGDLSVQYREALLTGGSSGPAIIPGNPETSLLIKAIRHDDDVSKMPPKGEKLSEAEIKDFIAWVKMGAPDPRKFDSGTQASYGATAKDHWAFQPVKKPAVPEVKNKSAVKTPVDAFILAKLEENGMKHSSPAEKRTLIRRATFDLHGLPPTQQEVNAFLADDSPDAFAKVVDRLLASPRYGERWGRYWLDVARYSDTRGDIPRNRMDENYQHAWTYRDYVIRSFNEDKPFNRFIIEQIAADKIPLGTNRWTLAALGFLTLGDRFNNNRHDIINDRIDVVTKGLMGLTVTCARCHDHKFDPVSQKDYYALHGVFANTYEPEIGPALLPIKQTAEYQDYAKKLADYEAQAKELPNRRGRRTQQELREERDLRRDYAKLEMTHPAAPPRAHVMFDVAKPRDSRVFIRGEAGNPGPVVQRRFLEILSGTNSVFKQGSGRYELALSVVHTNNPLTSRALVNRVWLHHFGEGFVTTPDDLGNQSSPPSHPELLDYLAARFMEEGWSMKKLHRLIMLSSTYQQSSANNPDYAQKDPDNRLLWRAHIRRLDIEAVRDSILAIGGNLDLTMGGRPVDLGEAPYSKRRTVYGFVDRRNLPEIYTQFDFANPDISTGKRYQTIVPQQSLFMMNSPLVIEQARSIVQSESFRKLSHPEEKIRYLYSLIYQRFPMATELQLGLEFIETSPPNEKVQAQRKQPQRRSGNTMSLVTLSASDYKPLDAWAKYAHALLQANETMFVN
ncbi:MAG: PSD1 and planctomycete cytochrome C domain-containing protein [Limisphaerales bacterium]